MVREILETDDCESWLDYRPSEPMYGLPLFKATAEKYGWENPIGDDSGSEDYYNEEYDEGLYCD